MQRFPIWFVFVVAMFVVGATSSTCQSPAASQAQAVPREELTLPLIENSVRFAVIGDTGTGGSAQFEISEVLTRYHQLFPFSFVLMLGDNMYGGEDPDDFLEKFELPYKELLSRGVEFRASLGNHDEQAQRLYKPFNMGGKRYYTFKKESVRFFALDSDYLDPEQVQWLEKELEGSDSTWKIVFFHHPLYSSGDKHGPSLDIREILEPIFLRHGVAAVFNGHEHFYERIRPQKGIYYFICGSSGKLREGSIQTSRQTLKGFDSDNAFMLVEIADKQMYIQTISRRGRTVDSAMLPHLRIPVEQAERTEQSTEPGESLPAQSPQ